MGEHFPLLFRYSFSVFLCPGAANEMIKAILMPLPWHVTCFLPPLQVCRIPSPSLAVSHVAKLHLAWVYFPALPKLSSLLLLLAQYWISWTNPLII